MPVCSSISISSPSYAPPSIASSAAWIAPSSCFFWARAALVLALSALGEPRLLPRLPIDPDLEAEPELLGLICDIIMVDCMPVVLILDSLSGCGGSAFVMILGSLTRRSYSLFFYCAFNYRKVSTACRNSALISSSSGLNSSTFL